MSRPTAQPGHLPALDGVRGVAILLVLAFHWLGPFGDTLLGARIVAPARIGWLGVDLFFVLSGFLITGILLDRRGAPGATRAFFTRRALRIWPLYVLVVAVQTFVATATTWLPADERADFLAAAPWVWAHVSNWYLGDPAVAYKNALGIAAFWSLAIEEQYYLFWPLCLWAAPRAWAGRLCALVAVGSYALRVWWVARGYDPGFVYMATLTRLDGLALGGWLAVAARDPRVWATLGRLAGPLVASPIRAVLALAALMVVAMATDPSMSGATAGGLLLVMPLGTLLAAWLLVGAAHAPADAPLARVLSARWLRGTGRVSYGLYLLHGPVWYAVHWANVGAGLAWPRAAVICVSAVGSVLLALASWRWWEQPWLRLRPSASGAGRQIGETAATRVA